MVTSTLVICSGSVIGTVAFHHGAFSVLVCVQLPEPQLGLALPSMARGELPPWAVELCVVDAPVIETADGVSQLGPPAEWSSARVVELSSFVDIGNHATRVSTVLCGLCGGSGGEDTRGWR